MTAEQTNGGGGGKWKIEQYSGRPETAMMQRICLKSDASTTGATVVLGRTSVKVSPTADEGKNMFLFVPVSLEPIFVGS